MGRREHSAKTRDVMARLAAEGWTVARKGPGDHVQYRHPTKPGRVTIDTGAREQTTGTLRSIYSACPGKVGTGFPKRTCATQRIQAGWEW